MDLSKLSSSAKVNLFLKDPAEYANDIDILIPVLMVTSGKNEQINNLIAEHTLLDIHEIFASDYKEDHKVKLIEIAYIESDRGTYDVLKALADSTLINSISVDNTIKLYTRTLIRQSVLTEDSDVPLIQDIAEDILKYSKPIMQFLTKSENINPENLIGCMLLYKCMDVENNLSLENELTKLGSNLYGSGFNKVLDCAKLTDSLGAYEFWKTQYQLNKIAIEADTSSIDYI